MPYCSSVSKLAGYDETEVEIQSEDLDGTTISYQIHLNRPCAECGTEAAEADLELSVEIEHECEDPDTSDEDNFERDGVVWLVSGKTDHYTTRAEALVAADDKEDLLIAQWDDDIEPEFELDSEADVEATDDTQNKDRHGKPIKNVRYMRRLLGAQVTAHVRCTRCDEVFDMEGSDNMPASSFEAMSH